MPDIFVTGLIANNNISTTHYMNSIAIRNHDMRLLLSQTVMFRSYCLVMLFIRLCRFSWFFIYWQDRSFSCLNSFAHNTPYFVGPSELPVRCDHRFRVLCTIMVYVYTLWLWKKAVSLHCHIYQIFVLLSYIGTYIFF